MSQCADNYRFDITAWDGHHDFSMMDLCLKIAFADHKTVTHWSHEPGVLAPVENGRFYAMWKKPPRLILYWWDGDSKDLTPFLAPMTYEAAVGAVRAWLEGQDYANEPDHDGSNSRGWRIYNEAWGHVGGHRGAICAVEPAWLMHGK